MNSSPVGVSSSVVEGTHPTDHEVYILALASPTPPLTPTHVTLSPTSHLKKMRVKAVLPLHKVVKI